MKILTTGLRRVLERYDRTKDDFVEDKKGHWSVGTGGYDCWWELYYDHCPVACCILGELINECLDHDEFVKLRRCVEEVYPEMRRRA